MYKFTFICYLVLLSGCQSTAVISTKAPSSKPPSKSEKITLDSHEKNRNFVAWLASQKGKVIDLNIHGVWPYVSIDRGTCGSVLWEVEPETEDELFISGTQLCFKNDIGEYYSEFAGENVHSKQLYMYDIDDVSTRIQGKFKVAGEIDRGRFGIWTIGLDPLPQANFDD